ncbi:uncharacterized protein BO80DRAFT_291819 [Aspergillus ibericus CBS 121593]|uniref:Uncharacterized protein n=1 Tax=Aspergillus ibericus CBS 121593 TaxID=1448316 RepID=A0A395GJK4_9EURO|nr:hypothetical protein BO80DRAFT_291819 [Aspergillus ibericus CBS 121593]RAK94937.1 hypothetical protein BO80DRAFT_291819 [Aspergillus ibericus CBS 121593]
MLLSAIPVSGSALASSICINHIPPSPTLLFILPSCLFLLNSTLYLSTCTCIFPFFYLHFLIISFMRQFRLFSISVKRRQEAEVTR